MTKKILTIIFSTALLLTVPMQVNATNAIEIVDVDFEEITISVRENTLRITGANGQTVQIYNIAGVRVKSFKVEGQDKHYELNLPKGCYIVKVGKIVRKISIR